MKMITPTGELTAALADLETTWSKAPQEMPSILQQQISATRDTLRLVGTLRPVPRGQVVAQSEHQGGVQHGWTLLWEDDGTPIVATKHRAGLVQFDTRPGHVDPGR